MWGILTGMTEVLQANVFFVITSIAVVVFTLLMCVLLYHLIKIVRAIRKIVERVEAGSEVLAEDIDNIRASLNPARLVQFVMSMIPGVTPKKRTRKQSKNDD